MNKIGMSLLYAFVVVMLALGSLMVFASEEEKATPETFRARTALTPHLQLDYAVPLDFVVDRYTSEAELKEFATILKTKGVNQLKMTLERVSVGRISTPGDPGTAIAIARLHKTDKGKAVRLVTARTMSAVQIRYGDGDQYPFSMIELYPETGEGLLIGTLKPYFNEAGQLSIKVAGEKPVKLIEVKQVK